MQDFNLPGSLSQARAQVATNQQALATTTSLANSLASQLIPASISQAGQTARINDINGNLLGIAKRSITTDGSVSAVKSNDSQSVFLFSPRKTLFDALISAQQQQSILDATVQQTNLAKLTTLNFNQLATRNAIVTNINNQTLTLKLTPPVDGLQQISLKSNNTLNNLQVGQQVQVQLVQSGDKWNARILSAPVQNIDKPSIPSTAQQTQATNKTSPLLEIPLQSRDPLLKSIIKANLQQGVELTQSPKILNSILPLLSKSQVTIAKQAMQQPSSSAIIRLDSQGKLNISAQLPITQIPVEPNTQTVSSPSPLNILSKPVEAAIQQFLKLPLQQRQPLYDFLKALPEQKTTLNVITNTSQISARDQLAADKSQLTRSGLPATETAKQTASIGQSIQTMPKAFIEQVSTLIRQHFVNATPNSETANILNSALTELSQSREPNLQNVSKQVQQALAPLLTKAAPDTTQLQAMLQMPSLPVTTSTLTQIAPVNSMVSGLVALLQLSLASRLPQRQTGSAERIGQLLNKITQSAVAQPVTTATTQAPANARQLQEFSQLEQRHQLIRTLSKALSNHHFSKLSSAESSLQGTDSFFYSLPSYASSSQRDIELLIKREEYTEKDQKDNATQNATWHLTMLLDIGKFGEALTKCKLNGEDLQLDIYTSSEALKVRVLEFLPLLKKRLDSLGLNILSSQCQLGKIPDSLRPKPYQLLNTQA